MRILVSDGNERAALAVTRSLGRRGHEVTVLSNRGRSLAGRSRFAAGERRATSALASPAAFLDDATAAAAAVRAEVFVPVSEAALLAVLGARERFPGTCIPFPPFETFSAVSDKERVLAVARDLGIAVPEQHVAASPAQLRQLADAGASYPLVVKPARSVSGTDAVRRKLSVRHAPDAAALARLATELPEAAYPVLLQQRIVGPGTGIFLLPWQGALRAIFAHRRVREKPPSGGVSVCSESVTADAGLVEHSRRLLDAFGWQGVAMVEYKRDAASGIPYLMEINGRFWGSLQLAIDSGVDFPALLLECALGRPPVAPPSYRTGQRLRWFWGDTDHLLMRLRSRSRALDLPPGSPGRARVVFDWLASSFRPGQRSEPWRLDDPSPFLHETAEWFGALLGRRGGQG